METQLEIDLPPSLASTVQRSPPRAPRKTFPFSLGVSVVGHASLAIAAWAHHPFAVMRGGGQESRGTFVVSISPQRSQASRAQAQSRQAGDPEDPVEVLGALDEVFVVPDPELVAIDLPEEVPRPDQPRLGGALLAEVDWEKQPWEFHSQAAQPSAAAQAGGTVVGDQRGTGSEQGSSESGSLDDAIVGGSTVAGTSADSSSTTGSGDSTPGVEGGNGPVLIRERSKDPEYPQRAQQRRIEGKVLLRITVSSRGAVKQVKVVESSGYSILDRAAVDGVEKWVFEPAKRDGVPVETEILHYITFKLEDA